MSTTTTRRGGTIPELVAGIAALVLLAALVIPGAARMRTESRTASSLSQLRWIAGTTNAYAADSADRFWTYSWKAGPLPHRDPTLPATAETDLLAAAIQATGIIRRLGGRSDFDVITGWIPHVQFSHLPLVDYTEGELPNLNFVAPGDQHRLKWARDPVAFDLGAFLPFQPEPSDRAQRFPYTSSYQPSVGFWDRTGSPESRVRQGPTHYSWALPSGVTLGGASLPEVTFPSQKVMLNDIEQRGSDRPVFFADRKARVATLMGDGSAGLRPTADSNIGWHPQFPTSSAWTHFSYEPAEWEAPSTSTDPLTGHYRWTRGGIKGRDFGGPEVDTGQP